jgi:SAM-dependent methyltransferase
MIDPARDLAPRLSALAEGLGSAYERYAINVFLQRLARAHGIRTVAEWPANGVLGVPGIKSLALHAMGCEVTLLHPDPAFHDDVATIWQAASASPPGRLVAETEDCESTPARAFDLVWSFCALEHTRDPRETMRAMLRASRGLVLVFVQNVFAPGVHLHHLEHRLQRKPWDHGRISDMSAGAVADHVRAAGGEVIAEGGCDLPPWPDLNVRLPRPWERDDGTRSARARRYGPGDPVMTTRAVRDVFHASPALSRTMRALLAWHDAVEAHLPQRLLRAVAHHPYVLARP